jgi:hypothetical protein
MEALGDGHSDASIAKGERPLCREQLRANSPHFLDERDPATPLN